MICVPLLKAFLAWWACQNYQVMIVALVGWWFPFMTWWCLCENVSCECAWCIQLVTSPRVWVVVPRTAWNCRWFQWMSAAVDSVDPSMIHGSVSTGFGNVPEMPGSLTCGCHEQNGLVGVVYTIHVWNGVGDGSWAYRSHLGALEDSMAVVDSPPLPCVHYFSSFGIITM